MPLAEQAVNLPGKLKVRGLSGGTDMWERACVAWDLGQSLPEFEARPQDQQHWLLAVWRTKRKLDRIRLIDADRDNA